MVRALYPREESQDERLAVVMINPHCRYAIITEHAWPPEIIERMRILLQKWWRSDDPFVFINGVKFVRIEDLVDDKTTLPTP